MPHLGVDVSAHGLWQPRRLVELSPPLLLWVSRHIRHQLCERKRGSEAHTRRDALPLIAGNPAEALIFLRLLQCTKPLLCVFLKAYLSDGCAR